MQHRIPRVTALRNLDLHLVDQNHRVTHDHPPRAIHLPPGDRAYAERWKAIKFAFPKRLTNAEPRTDTQQKRGERGIWQRRYWEHLIRDDLNDQRHFDCIHFNPVKHGHVRHAQDWPFSSFDRAVKDGIYPADWAGHESDAEGGRWRE
ncbi:REP-associated tyrosine transposase [Pseudomonas sp. JS3066]|uniref:REP-associated tyrosine transposase n=1 Tax=Pseudomonas sp. JS3066 TaxID=3090665 RepID=UPI003FA6E22E